MRNLLIKRDANFCIQFSRGVIKMKICQVTLEILSKVLSISLAFIR